MYVKLESGDIQKLHGKRLLLFGAGSLGVRSIEECRKIDAEILGFIDNNPSRRGEKLEGYPIYGPQDIRQFPDAYVLITSTYVDEIKEQLAVMGIKKVEVIRLGALRDTIDQEAFYRPLMTKQESNWYLYEHLCGEQPFFAGRLGSNELECMTEYYYVLDRAGCGHGKDGTGAEVRDHDEKEALDKGSRNLGAKEAYHDNLKLVMKQGAGFFPVEDVLSGYIQTTYKKLILFGVCGFRVLKTCYINGLRPIRRSVFMTIRRFPMIWICRGRKRWKEKKY